MKDDQIKPVHYLVKHEEIKYSQKNYFYPIVADFGEDQFSILINNKGKRRFYQTCKFIFLSIYSSI